MNKLRYSLLLTKYRINSDTTRLRFTTQQRTPFDVQTETMDLIDMQNSRLSSAFSHA